MIRFLASTAILVFLLLVSCRGKQRANYSVKDFRSAIRPFLLETINKGLNTSPHPLEIGKITDQELVLLTEAESPLLRSMAMMERLKRNKESKLDLLLSHLDDTAMIAIDEGEFGLGFRTVSDFLLMRTHDFSDGELERLNSALLSRHNYLSHAYEILPGLAAQNAYYPYIRDMATRPRRVDSDGFETGFREIENALYALAKFEKKNDIGVIKQQLLAEYWRLSTSSFRLMTEFPDTSYLEILNKYHDHNFYRFSGFRPDGFTGFPADRASPEDFINAVIAQKTTGSAKILDSLLTRLANFDCFPDKEGIVDYLAQEIWQDSCKIYSELRQKVGPRVKEMEQRRIELLESMYY